MDYIFESLGDEKFQRFCQALLVNIFPNLQCLPVGQPDGGRDAISQQRGGFIVFQVKYSKNPSMKGERDAISGVISSEKLKVNNLIRKGAIAYYLMTNVSGTSHPDSGSIDKINEELSSEFEIPCHVWWHDDLERRLEISPKLLWRYPELARGQDFLEYLAQERKNDQIAADTKTFSLYMAAQYQKEIDVKFQQVQIHNNLLDLFTDTPIGLARDKMPTRHSLAMSDQEYKSLEMIFSNQRHIYYGQTSDEMMAAQWLLRSSPQDGAQKIVLEGAPGQGKSTVTQYLCQVHRAIALNKTYDKGRIPEKYLNNTLRLPVRVDLRDYALWLTGKDPMAEEKNVNRPVESDDSLESLISHQIRKLSGGRNFSIESLASVTSNAHLILVLDGFDEVADINTRTKLIDQIKMATERLSSDCTSLQVIVTSRPAAFILSPGFPERDWAHIALLPLGTHHIMGYSEKWIRARGLSEGAGREFKKLLLDRINRPHIRSLAQNPMQLAILLNLVSTKGMSLPDKRTALYDSYIDLFFGREAEKSPTVRENRDVLLQIHQYVAWKLQLDAEVPGGRGSISQNDLKKLVSNFLIEKEHKGDVLSLFTGVVERVGALVSRVQGTLEFEVQPLREYFAGKFLYETAPYSPAGSERHGTKPERFSALARRPYWSNVLRFYAGCYSSGELLSLMAGLEELNDNPQYALKIHSLQLATSLLGDYVFAQEPKTVRKVIEFLTKGHHLRYLLADNSSWVSGRLSLPDKCGRAELAEKAANIIGSLNDLDYMPRIGALYVLNSSIEDRWNFWKDLNKTSPSRLDIAIAIGILNEANSSHIREVVEEFGDAGSMHLISCGRWDALSLDQRIGALKHLLEKASDGRRWFHNLAQTSNQDIQLLRVYFLMEPVSYQFFEYSEDKNASFGNVLARFSSQKIDLTDEDTARFDEHGLGDIIKSCERAIKYKIIQWQTDLEPWNDIIESARRTWGDSIRIKIISAIAAGIKSKLSKSTGFSEFFDKSLPLAERSRYARLQTSPTWWHDKINYASNYDEKIHILLLFLSWAPGSVFVKLGNKIEATLDELPEELWARLFNAASAVVMVTANSRGSFSNFTHKDAKSIKSDRMKIALMLRVSKSIRLQLISTLLSKRNISDKTIIRYVAEISLSEATTDEKLWPMVLNFYNEIGKELYNLEQLDFEDGFFSPPHRTYFPQRNVMPQAASKKVMADPARYPIQVLESAETACFNSSENTLMSLGQVAEIEKWFEPEV